LPAPPGAAEDPDAPPVGAGVVAPPTPVLVPPIPVLPVPVLPVPVPPVLVAARRVVPCVVVVAAARLVLVCDAAA